MAKQLLSSSILDTYFDETTMSVHIQQGLPIVAKKGHPGERHLVTIQDAISPQQVQQLLTTIRQEVEASEQAYLEIDRAHSQVIQLGLYRVVIVTPPVSDSIELTIVRQIKQVDINVYELPQQAENYLLNQAKGILIAGAPGQGKSTFAQAYIDQLAHKEVIIKTIESPRDLIVPDNVTQYSFTHASHSELRDILLLSRPDYTVYDEVRNKEDFHLYKDLRLTGIGLIGVMHATEPIDSIQRFLSVVDMGSIPQVIDTIVFIRKGTIEQLLTLDMTVKTPIGMESDDLARPVIQVHDYLQEKILYEIYSYGDSVVVMPCEQVQKATNTQDGIKKFAKRQLEHELKSQLGCKVSVEVIGMKSITLYVPPHEVGRIIGKRGQHIEELEKQYGLTIQVKTTGEIPHQQSDIPYSINEVNRGKNTYVQIQLDESYGHQDITLHISGTPYAFTADPYGCITIKKRKLVQAILAGEFSL